MGDFNVTPSHADSRLLTGDGWHDAHVASSALQDATHLKGDRMDHIFYQGTGITPQTWTVVRSPDPEPPLSDHYPVSVRFRIEGLKSIVQIKPVTSVDTIRGHRKEHRQRIASQPINRRTRMKRLVRRTICCSKTEPRHDLVLGLFINRDACGRAIEDVESTPVRHLPGGQP